MIDEFSSTTDFAVRMRESGTPIVHDVDELMEAAEDLGPNSEYMHAGMDLYETLKFWGKKGKWSIALEGEGVIDFAAGAATSNDNPFTDSRPHFSRLCAANGAKVTAVDMYPQTGIDKEILESIQAELIGVVMGDGLDNHPQLKGRRFPVVHSANFIGNPPPELENALEARGIPYEVFEARFIEQAGRLVASGGIMKLGNKDNRGRMVFYTKEEDQLIAHAK